MIKKGTIMMLCSMLLAGLSCSKFSITKEIDKGSKVSTMKKAGVLLRVSQSGEMDLDDQRNNLSGWISGYKPIRELSIIKDTSEKISYFNSDIERFYQSQVEEGVMSYRHRFLLYKSLGVINLFLRNNSAELKKIISDNGLDGLIIYEVYSVLSTEMQFMDFDSIVLVVDSGLNVLFMDHQSDGFETHEIDIDRIRELLLNNISERLVVNLLAMDFIDTD